MPQWSKGFRIAFVAVMSVLCVTLCVLTVRQASLAEQLRLKRLELDASTARLEFQQTQQAQILTDLPQTQAQLAAVQPEAEAASAREQALRELRKQLRSENAALVAQADELTQQLTLLQSPDSELIGEVEALQNVLSSLQAQVDAARQLLEQAEEP